MSNMSYCRFENTSNDLEDCVGAMAEAKTMKEMNLSSYEAGAIKHMAGLAQEFMDQYDRLTANEVA